MCISEGRQGWRAELNLGYELRSGKTRLTHSKRQGPLAVQRGFYPEGPVCHTYLLHPPGGVVAGDQLNLNVHVNDQSHVLITTPGATKFYRSNGPEAFVKQVLTVEAGGIFEWLPLENIFFPETNSHILTEVHLHGDATFVGWEINCFGRPSNAERFSGGHVKSELHVFRDRKPLLFDRFETEGEHSVNSPVGLRSVSGYSSMMITLNDPKLAEKVQRYLVDDPLSGASLVDGLLIVRTISEQAHEVVSLFSHIWSMLRPYITDREASVPRIWAT